MKDYYKILELEKTASAEDIKKSYRRLSKIHHPDKEGDSEKFKEINEAYQTLSNKEKKQAYDSGTTYLKAQRPVINDINIRIKWTLSDIKNGKTVKVTVPKITICKTCNGVGSKKESAVTTCQHCGGSGRFIRAEKTPFGFVHLEQMCPHCNGIGEENTDPCPTCHGHKMVNENFVETIVIPPNTIIPFRKTRAGHHTIHGDSDLVIYFDVSEKDGVVLINDSLHLSVKVDFYEGLLGVPQMVKFGDTTLKVLLTKETKNGQNFRLSKAYCNIDVIIHVEIEFPTLERTRTYLSEVFPEIKEEINKTFKK